MKLSKIKQILLIMIICINITLIATIMNYNYNKNTIIVDNIEDLSNENIKLTMQITEDNVTTIINTPPQEGIWILSSTSNCTNDAELKWNKETHKLSIKLGSASPLSTKCTVNFKQNTGIRNLYIGETSVESLDSNKYYVLTNYECYRNGVINPNIKVILENRHQISLSNIELETDYCDVWVTQVTQKNDILALYDDSANLTMFLDGEFNTGDIQSHLNARSNTNTWWRDLKGYNQRINTYLENEPVWGDTYIHLDGEDDYISTYINTPTEAYLDVYTIEVVVAPGENDGEKIIVGNHESGGFGIEIYDGKFANITYINGLKRQSASESYSADEIYHVAGTYDGNNLRLYINGEEQGTGLSATGTITDPIYNTSSMMPIMIGANPKYDSTSETIIPDENGCYNGKIYLVRIYNKALDTGQINSNYIVDKIRYGF